MLSSVYNKNYISLLLIVLFAGLNTLLPAGQCGKVVKNGSVEDAKPLVFTTPPTNGSDDNHVATDPDVGKNALQLIVSKGYPGEEHTIATEDGYFLTMQRIPFGKKEWKTYDPTAYRPVVFLQHGLTGSATNWISNLPSESLGFILADAGMDVWLGNVRGNTYSKGHASLSVFSKQFWEFTWDQMAKYDIPAMLNHALTITRAPHLYYAGHSQGTLVGFTGFSIEQNKEISSKVKHFFALAPVYTTRHLRNNLLLVLGEHIDIIKWIFDVGGIFEFAPNYWTNNFFAKQVCGKNAGNNPLCLNTFFQAGGTSSTQMNDTRRAVYTDQNPAGTSTQNMAHFGQMTKHERCVMYDFGSSSANQAHYGQDSPPEYFVENMTVPVTLFVGDQDTLADPDDVNLLIPRITAPKTVREYTGFNHVDFVLGLRAPAEVYTPMVETINKEEAEYWAHHKKSK